jgi:hypothetical protein
MIESGFWGRCLSWASALAVCGLLFCTLLPAQSDDSPPLGDVARSVRKKKQQPLPEHAVIDNDNLSQVMDEVESHRLASSSLLYSFDSSGKTFQVSAPDATCTLSFNANSTALLSRPYVPIDLPDDELHKLDGPATISDDGLQISIFNGTEWKLEEITVGLTIVRHNNPTAAPYGPGRLVPAAAETVIAAEKQPDVTTIHHLRATALPSTTAVFKTPLSVRLSRDEEWHWAIIQAKGIPPARLMAIPVPPSAASQSGASESQPH